MSVVQVVENSGAVWPEGDVGVEAVRAVRILECPGAGEREFIGFVPPGEEEDEQQGAQGGAALIKARLECIRSGNNFDEGLSSIAAREEMDIGLRCTYS